jgi:DNA gyrase inhibitor GyrI
MADLLRLSPWLVVDVDALAEVQCSRVIEHATYRLKGCRRRRDLYGQAARTLRAWVDEQAPLPEERELVAILQDDRTCGQGPTTG